MGARLALALDAGEGDVAQRRVLHVQRLAHQQQRVAPLREHLRLGRCNSHTTSMTLWPLEEQYGRLPTRHLTSGWLSRSQTRRRSRASILDPHCPCTATCSAQQPVGMLHKHLKGKVACPALAVHLGILGVLAHGLLALQGHVTPEGLAGAEGLAAEVAPLARSLAALLACHVPARQHLQHMQRQRSKMQCHSSRMKVYLTMANSMAL